MSSNVGLSTPRGSGTSGYVQRNYALLKPRNAGYGAPYPPPGAGTKSSSSSNKDSLDAAARPFHHRQPDRQILEHDRRRAIEVKVLEEQERLEEENERLEEAKDKEKKILSEEEIEERCNELRKKLLRELEDAEDRKRKGESESSAEGGRRNRRRGMPPPPRERRQFKSYQVHELAEAKIEESERLRKALGIREDWERERDREEGK